MQTNPFRGAHYLLNAHRLDQLPADAGAEIAFAGRSNAGKSSALNTICDQQGLARTSKTPGRTQQIVVFALQRGGLVADLPGYGYAAVPHDVKRAWQQFLWEYVTTRSTLVGLVLVVDSRHGLKALDTALLDGYLPSARPLLVLATKSDKLNRAERRDAAAAIRAALDQRYPHASGVTTVLPFSAASRDGVEEADAVLESWLPRE